MKGLLLALFMISPAVNAAGTMSCAQLGDYISANHRDILTAKNGTSPACSSDTLPELTEGRDDAEVSSVIDELGCQPLSVIDESISKIETEIALLMGIKQLKRDVATNQAEAAGPETTRSKKAAQEFLQALVTARSLESILNTQSDVPLIRSLKDIPVAQRNTPATFANAINSLCTRRAGLQATPGHACGQGFTVSDEAVAELNALIDSSQLSDSQLAEWSRTLAITKQDGQTAYSFNEMFNDIEPALQKIKNGQLGVTRDALKRIRELPTFQDAYPLSFMNALAGRSQKMSVHVAVDGARNLVEELKNRQNTQTMSKVSWLMKEAGASMQLTDEQRAFCDQMRADISKTRLCWNAVKNAEMPAPARGLVESMTGTIESSLSYLDDLSGANNCLSETNLAQADKGFQFDTPECEKLNATDEVLNKKVARAKALKVLKDKISAKNDRKIKMTNFALSKFTEQCSPETSYSDIECPAGASIAPQAQTLFSNLFGAIVRTDTTTPDIAEICDDPEATEVNLCRYVAAPPKNPDTTNPPIPSKESPYVEVEGQRNDQMNDAIAGAGWAIVNQLQQRPQMYGNPYMNYNPYPYYNNPYSGMMGMSPADQMLFSARFYGGYGYYTPTYGTAPYTAFPLVSPYVQAGYSSTGNTSSYFTNFGTYK
jgi:hypothetical protein